MVPDAGNITEEELRKQLHAILNKLYSDQDAAEILNPESAIPFMSAAQKKVAKENLNKYSYD